MRIVHKLPARPHCCAVYPHLGSQQIEGYIETGTTLPEIDPEIYVSVVAARAMAELIGWVPGDRLLTETQKVDEANQRVRELEAENAELHRRFESIDVLASAGYVARKKPGRPPTSKKTEEVAA